MGLFSKQEWYCNCCGIKMFSELGNGIASVSGKYRVCSMDCSKEMEWKYTLSIMGQPYYPHPDQIKKTKEILGEDDI